MKKYNLSEIGIFYKSIILLERENTAKNLQINWLSNNLSKEGLVEELKSFESKPKKEHADTEKINKDWRKLAFFMNGRK